MPVTSPYLALYLLPMMYVWTLGFVRASNRLLLRRWRSDISAARRPSTLIHFYGPAVCSQAAEAAANEPHIFIGLQPPAAAVNKPELLA